MSDGDLLQRFLFERYPVRGHIVHLDASWRAATEHHDYPAAVGGALGEALAATALLAGSMKFEGQLSLQLQGPGPVHLLLAQCTHRHAIRGVARHQGEPSADAGLPALFGDGRLAVTIEQERRRDRYQGVVPLDQPRLSDCLERYFERSEQVPTRMVLAASGERAAGLLLQRIAVGHGSAEDPDPRAVAEADDAWRRIGMLAATLQPAELLTLPSQQLLQRLFAEDDLRLFDGEPVWFQCSCSRERVEAILRSLGRAEADDILQEQGAVEVRCEFCNRGYRFDAVDVAAVFASPGRGQAPSGLH